MFPVSDFLSASTYFSKMLLLSLFCKKSPQPFNFASGSIWYFKVLMILSKINHFLLNFFVLLLCWNYEPNILLQYFKTSLLCLIGTIWYQIKCLVLLISVYDFFLICLDYFQKSVKFLKSCNLGGMLILLLCFFFISFLFIILFIFCIFLYYGVKPHLTVLH